MEDVAEHLSLGVVRVEYKMGEEFRRASERRRNASCSGLGNPGKNPCRSRSGRSEYADQCFKVFMADRLVEGNTDVCTVYPPKVDEFERGRSVDDLCILANRRHVDSQGVKIGVIDNFEPKMLNAGAKKLSEKMDFLRDARQTDWTMVYGIHGGHVCEESLTSTDVTGCFFSTDVLLSG